MPRKPVSLAASPSVRPARGWHHRGFEQRCPSFSAQPSLRRQRRGPWPLLRRAVRSGSPSVLQLITPCTLFLGPLIPPSPVGPGTFGVFTSSIVRCHFFLQASKMHATGYHMPQAPDKGVDKFFLVSLHSPCCLTQRCRACHWGSCWCTIAAPCSPFGV